MKKTKFRLPREFAEKWVADLRSGRYTQGKNSLANVLGAPGSSEEYSFCCIGVACVTAGADVRTILREADISVYRENSLTAFKNVPKELQYSTYTAEDLLHRCIHLNDNKEYSFEEIADWIEVNVEFY